MNRIAELRKLHNLTQKQLAELIGIRANTISQYESGLRKPISRNVNAMAKLFQVTPAFLLGFSEPESGPSDNEQFTLDKVREIIEVNDYGSANLYLSAGWRLIGITAGKDAPIYSLGWDKSVTPPDFSREANTKDNSEQLTIRDLNDDELIEVFGLNDLWNEEGGQSGND